MNFGDKNFFPTIANKSQLLQRASKIDTSYYLIENQIKNIEIYLDVPSNKNRKLAEEQLATLKDLSISYNTFKHTTFTKNTNIKIKKLFERINSDDKFIGNFNGLDNKINNKINNELSKLRDTFIFETDTFRDNVERNVNFVGEYIHGTYNETSKMNIFLNYLTVEYINFLDSNNIKYPNLINSKIMLSIQELKIVLNKVKFRMKNINYNFTLKFNLIDGIDKTTKLENILNKSKKNKSILESQNNLEEIINNKIKGETEIFYNNSLLKNYYKKFVIGVLPKITRADYVIEKFREIKIPDGVKAELVKIIQGLPAQESKYNNFALNPKSGAFGIFQFTDLNFIDSIKSGRLLKCEFLDDIEKKQINELKNLDKLEIENHLSYKKLKNTFKSSMKKITWASINYFEFLYKTLTKIILGNYSNYITNDRKNFGKIIKKYGLNKKEENKFMTYMMINGYNSGGTKINILLSEFSKKDVVINTKYTALSLLYEITTFGKKQKDSLALYDVESSEYVWKVISGSNAIFKLKRDEKKLKKK